MSLPDRVAGKVGLLIPRLGSPFDNEVVATARAIQRTLVGSGKDLHDLAKTLTKPVPAPPPDRSAESSHWSARPEPPSGPPRWSRLNSGDRLIWLDGISALHLNDWEREFVQSIATTLAARPNACFSEKQIVQIERLMARAWREECETRRSAR